MSKLLLNNRYNLHLPQFPQKSYLMFEVLVFKCILFLSPSLAHIMPWTTIWIIYPTLPSFLLSNNKIWSPSLHHIVTLNLKVPQNFGSFILHNRGRFVLIRLLSPFHDNYISHVRINVQFSQHFHGFFCTPVVQVHCIPVQCDLCFLQFSQLVWVKVIGLCVWNLCYWKQSDSTDVSLYNRNYEL